VTGTRVRPRFLQRKLGYGTVGGLVVWLTVIAVFVASLIFLSSQLPTD
jgi:hypothetical protein